MYHIPVLLNECIENLNIDKDKTYVDATLGGGGHSEKILEILDSGSGKLIAIDQDEEAIKSASERLKKYIDNQKLIVVKNNFENIDSILDDLNIEKIDGILFDLGVSSHQFDEKDRGFSYRIDSKLDMRMDKSNPLTAEILVNTFDEKKIYEIIRDFGEDGFAKNIAKHICISRKEKQITTTYELVEIIKQAIPAKLREGGTGNHPAKRTFQAIRIYINRELEVIDIALDKVVDRLNDLGRIAVISFHSLEDKLVKDKFKAFENPCTCPKGYPCVCGKISKGKMLKNSAITATEEELEKNNRSHSAKLRIFERRL